MAGDTPVIGNSQELEALRQSYMLPADPVRYQEDDLKRLLIHLSSKGASDINIQTGDEVRAQIHGLWLRVTRRKIAKNEVEDILNFIYGTNGSARIKAGEDIDKSWELRPSRLERYRFRVNATGGRQMGADAIQITIRTITSDPPSIDVLGLDPAIVNGFFPKDGVVIVVGPTGSGKSTTLAACMRSILEKHDSNKKIITFEAPIEYVYDSIEQPSSFSFQTEIGPAGNLGSFALATVNAMRRKPDVILLGETRDKEAVEASIHFSQSGHATYTTFHANSIADTVARMLNFFEHSARGAVAMDLLETLRLIVWQRLFIKPDGKGRVAVREFLVFDQEAREQMLSLGADNVDQIITHIKHLVRQRGNSMEQCAHQLYDAGQLSKADYTIITSKEV